jgi:hypothetical protein
MDLKWLSILTPLTIANPNNLSDEWIETFDWIGRGETHLHSPWNTDKLAKQKNIPTLNTSLLKAYQRTPEKTGLLKWLAVFASNGFSTDVPLQLTTTHIEGLDANSQDRAIFVTLSQGNIQDSYALALARTATRINAPAGWLSNTHAMREILRHHLTERWVCTFLIEALRISPASSNLATVGITLLNEILAENKSPLHARDRLIELGLGGIVRA